MPDYSKDKITEKDIIIKSIGDIQSKFLQEFRGGYKEKKIIGNNVEEVYVPDTRKEAIQAIEVLRDLLLPKFDEEMKRVHRLLIKQIKKERKKFQDGEMSRELYITNKLDYMQRIFQQIIIMLDRTKYFKKKITYG